MTIQRIGFSAVGVVLLVGAYCMFSYYASPREVHAVPAVVAPETCAQEGIQIVASVPPDGFVDVRQDEDAAGNPQGITTIQVTFSASVLLTADCIDVLTTGSEAPSILSVAGADTDWTIELDSPIPAEETTGIAFWGALVTLIYQSHPADVNLNELSDQDDVTALEAAVVAGSTDVDRYDIDRNGTINSADVVRLQDLLDGGYANADWSLPGGGTTFYCCCVGPVCEAHMGGCEEQSTEVACPCIPDPCGSVGN